MKDVFEKFDEAVKEFEKDRSEMLKFLESKGLSKDEISDFVADHLVKYYDGLVKMKEIDAEMRK